MTELEIFTAALELTAPWFIERIEFKPESDDMVLHIFINHTRRVRFHYEGNLYPVFDHQERTWQHMNFFQHRCFLHARVPGVKPSEGGIRLVDVPWAGSGSSFTLLFEDSILKLVEFGLSMTKAGEAVGISGKRVFNLVRNRVGHALATQPLEPIQELSIDETSSKRGHQYLTVLTDREAKKVVGVAPGKDLQAAGNALLDAQLREAEPSQVKCVTMDMSHAYIAAVDKFMPQAEIVFDRFHIAKKLNEHIDDIRRKEQQESRELRKTRYLWLKNNSNLNEKQRTQVDYLQHAYPTLGKAYRLKELFKEVMDEAHTDSRITPLNDWIRIAWDTGIEQMQDFVRFLHKHWYGIKSYFKKLATNAFAERVNLKIQEIKRIAKGYRNIHNFITVIYFHLGGLDLYKPTKYG